MSGAQGNNTHTVAGAAASVGKTLIGSMPANFLLLILLNVAFLAVVLRFVEGETSQRTEMYTSIIGKVLDTCPGKPAK